VLLLLVVVVVLGMGMGMEMEMEMEMEKTRRVRGMERDLVVVVVWRGGVFWRVVVRVVRR